MAGTRGVAAVGDGLLGNARGEDSVGEEAFAFEPGLVEGCRETLGEEELLLLEVLAETLEDGKDELLPDAVGLVAWVMLDGPWVCGDMIGVDVVICTVNETGGLDKDGFNRVGKEGEDGVAVTTLGGKV
jgi:hypothetical protein